MPRNDKGGKRVGKTTAPRSLSQGSSGNQMWWWIGGAAAVLLAAAVAIWFTLGPGKPASPAPTPSPTQPAEAPSPTVPSETTESSETAAPSGSSQEETSSMPAPSERNGMYGEPPEMQIDPSKAYVATISTEKGDIVVALDAAAAPQTVNNFVFLAQGGFYNDLIFHRVEDGFVIQGGDPTGTGTGGPGYTVPAEIQLKHVQGAIAMARRGDEINPERASSGSQFYITLEETPFLDGAYTAFGQVVEGMDVVQSIAVGDVIQSITVAEG